MPTEKKTDSKPIKEDKRRWDIIPLSMFDLVIEVFQDAGKDKPHRKGYERNSWRHCPPEEVFKKYLRGAIGHISEGQLNYLDKDSKKPHWAHAVANLLIYGWHAERDPRLQDFFWNGEGIAEILANEHNFGSYGTPEVYGDTEVPVTWINLPQNPLKTVDHIGMNTLYHEVDYEMWVKAFVDSLPDCNRVYLDVDGVICDFVGGMCKRYGKDPRLVREWDGLLKVCGITHEEMQEDIDDNDFIEGLEAYPWEPDLAWDLCERFRQFDIATAVDTIGRTTWIINKGYSADEHCIFDPEKWKYAKPGYLLIDDNEENIKKWEEAGGIGVLFPAPWNSRTDEAPHHQYYASLAK